MLVVWEESRCVVFISVEGLLTFLFVCFWGRWVDDDGRKRIDSFSAEGGRGERKRVVVSQRDGNKKIKTKKVKAEMWVAGRKTSI
jgi:hypothetical protein